jgi:hypothetical protein
MPPRMALIFRRWLRCGQWRKAWEGDLRSRIYDGGS